MKKSNKSEMRQYNGATLYASEVQVLETFEALIGEPIPQLQDKKSSTFGFSPEQGHIIELSIPARQLSYLPESLSILTRLNYLSLDQNQLESLPEPIGNLTSLKVLSLNENQLQSLPEIIGNLTNLVILWLDENQLQSLPEAIGNLTSLEVLSLAGNQLQSLPEIIGNLTNLEVLWLDENHLQSLPEAIGNLTSLERLRLTGNHLQRLPETINNLKHLEHFSLEENLLKTLEWSMWQFLSRINVVSLAGNPFELSAFKQVWRSLDRAVEEDEVLRKFLEAIADSIFPEAQYQELVNVFTGELP